MNIKKNIRGVVFTIGLFTTGLCSCGDSSNSNECIEDKVVTSDSYVDGNGVISFRGGSMKTVWKDKWRDGHQFRATIRHGHSVVSTTKCDYCKHQYQFHYSK